jgi:hypothetical protein
LSQFCFHKKNSFSHEETKEKREVHDITFYVSTRDRIPWGSSTNTPIVRVFVGGGQQYWGPTATRDELVTKKMAEILHRFAPEIQIVTGGMPGIADIFANAWEGSCLDVVSSEYLEKYKKRNTQRLFQVTGVSQEKRRLAVTNLEGIKCAVFIQGGKYSTHEIKLFQERGIPIVTLYGGGGAAGGQCPYDGWTYEPHASVKSSIVASTDPDANVFTIANVMAGRVLHNISETLTQIRFEEGEAKKSKKMDLTASMSGHVEEEERVIISDLMDIEEDNEMAKERARVLSATSVPSPRESPTKVAFALDIEGRGDNLLKNGILSIGWCVMRIDTGEILEKGRISLQPLLYMDPDDILFFHECETGDPDSIPRDVLVPVDDMYDSYWVKTQVFEERCLQEFWLNEEKFPGNKAKMQTMMGEAVDAMDGIKAFRNVLDKWDDGVQWESKILSDNVVYDCGWINYYLSLAGCRILALGPNNRYRRVFDTVDYRRGVCAMDYGDLWLNEREIIKLYDLDVDPDNHTHMPDDDAEYIAMYHIQLLNKVKGLPIGVQPIDPNVADRLDQILMAREEKKTTV